ncbi:element excision factor XisH family protein [Leptolyngbya sp. 'hensonii']|uniref:element excision factor XisH family protein n=1 Tax=Leptolyngbya sp. 'hensonii' TaxID=1922337 RepID=UPI0009F9082A|nr:element excision factor XisH family protein [Leptolyngbya sp. 'hensonii']
MSARDAFHDIVRTALQRDGWIITHDPYPLQAGSFDLAIDLGAEKVIAAQQGDRKIAVEIKSFLGPSKITEFYGAMGQFIAYRAALQVQEQDRIREHPSFARLPSSPSPFSLFGRRGARFKVPLPFWERDLGRGLQKWDALSNSLSCGAK